MGNIAFSMDFWILLSAVIATGIAYICVSRSADDPSSDGKGDSNDKNHYENRRNDVRHV